MAKTETLESFLEHQLNAQLLRYAASQSIMCPACGDIMDCRRTVVATIHRQIDGQQAEIVQNWVQCSKCWDKRKAKAQTAFDAVSSKHPELHARFEIVDGRNYVDAF